MRARRKNRLRNIRFSLNRFLSILLIVALGAGFLAGLLSATPDMFETADRYMDTYHWYDLDIRGLLGLTAEDAGAVAALPETLRAQPARVCDLILNGRDDSSYTARVFAVLDENGETELNGAELLEGRRPVRSGECMVQTVMGRYAGDDLRVGDVLTVSPENPGAEDIAARMTVSGMTVTGLCRSPMSISVETDVTTVGSGAVTLIVYAPETLFEDDGTFTDVFVTLRGAAEKDTFSEDYETLRADALPAYETLASVRGRQRADALRTGAEEQLDNARDVIRLLEPVRRVAGELAADAGERAAQTADTAEILEQHGNTAMAELLRGIVPGKTIPSVPLLDRLRDTVADTERTLEELTGDSWLIRTREDSAGFVSYRGNVRKVSALSRIFPVFFFLVALLVALNTMTRLVEENRSQIGVLKALGYPDAEIWREYLLYALLASLLGCGIGLAAGFRLFPSAIAAAYGMMYFLPDVMTPFRPDIALTVAPVTVGGIMLATLWACRSELRQHPAALLLPRAPAAGKRILLERIGPLWRRLSFIRKVTCRNLFRYRKRFIMTVIGVAGCSALLLTGFGLRDSINDIVEKQFGEIYRYELTVLTDGADAPDTDETLRSFLRPGGAVDSWTRYASGNGKVCVNGHSLQVTVGVPADPAAFASFVTLRGRKSGAPIELPDDGVILTEKLCEQEGIRIGDSVILENADGRRAALTVRGITENYLTSFAYLSPDAWRGAFGKEAVYTTLLCILKDDTGMTADEITAEAMRSGRAVFARNTQNLKDTFADTIRSFDLVVLVLILSAGLLSAVVLYNLTNVNICERKKELATIRVLGFYPREVQQYIFRETNALSLIGSVLGLFVGIRLHAFVVRTVEVDAVMFGRNIYPQSYLFALAISALFTVLVNQIMKKQIRGVDMVEAMKAND